MVVRGCQVHARSPDSYEWVNMRIKIKSSGGFAGYEQQEVGSVDTATLGADKARHLEDVVSKLLASTEQTVGADMMRYDVEICDDHGKTRELVLLDDGNPDNPLQQLLQAVS
jgi:hypothetical protein